MQVYNREAIQEARVWSFAGAWLPAELGVRKPLPPFEAHYRELQSEADQRGVHYTSRTVFVRCRLRLSARAPCCGVSFDVQSAGSNSGGCTTL